MNKVSKSKYFILLLLNCHKSQARAILETCNETQVLSLSEIALNFVSQDRKAKESILNKKRKVIERLGSRKLKERTKYTLICNHWEVVWKLVLEFKPTLKQLLQ